LLIDHSTYSPSMDASRNKVASRSKSQKQKQSKSEREEAKKQTPTSANKTYSPRERNPHFASSETREGELVKEEVGKIYMSEREILS